MVSGNQKENVFPIPVSTILQLLAFMSHHGFFFVDILAPWQLNKFVFLLVLYQNAAQPASGCELTPEEIQVSRLSAAAAPGQQPLPAGSSGRQLC